MCGIVGYIGTKEAYPILIKGLHRLEYRGYDSAGIALISDNQELNVYKTKGKVADLERFAESKDISGSIGIAHTRWATHGEPNDVNAHPHYSQSKNLALIHNGIIENYTVLRAELENKGYIFRSNTDTEVIVYLVEYIMRTNQVDLCTGVQLALHQVIGAYAIALMDKSNPNEIIAARKSSPLVVGIGKDEFFLASDATPIVEYTDKVVYLNDEEIAVIRRGEPLKVVDLNNVEITPEIKKLAMNLSQLEKGGYPHFMLKEIYEQPRTLQDCIRGRINVEGNSVVLSGVIDNRDKFLNANRIIIVACGTSWHAALIGEHLIEDLCRIPVEVEYASEFRYRNPVIHPGDIVIAISQSGETADTLAAIELAKSKGAFIYGICNVVGSSIARATDSGSYIHVGPEIGVASTKAFTGQVTVLSMLALTIAQQKGTITQARFEEMVKELQGIPEKISMVLKNAEPVKELSMICTYARNFIYLGRGYNYPAALEGALKLKEISYIHSEAYAAGELKHGTISLIEEGTLVTAILTQKELYKKSISNIVEVRTRGAFVLAITNEGNHEIEKAADYVVYIPQTNRYFANSLAIIPLQLFGYYISVGRGCDVDKPRNLAKSVTVE